MEFLKDLFGGQAMTYEQLSEAVKTKGLKVVDAANGAYLPKTDVDILNTQITTLTGQLGEANRKLEGFDPEWKTKAEQAQRDIDAMKLDFAVDKAVAASGAKNAKAVRAFLDREKLVMADGEVIGLDKQLDALKKSEDTAFLFQAAPPVKTGMSHQGGHEEAPDKKQEANEALRAIFGKEN